MKIKKANLRAEIFKKYRKGGGNFQVDLKMV